MVAMCYEIVSAKQAKHLLLKGLKNAYGVHDSLALYIFFVLLISNMVLQKSPQKTKARVDAVFFRQLRHLLSIVIPGPFSGEVGFLLLVALALRARSVCDLWLIHTSTYIEK
jgi:hypothetical protein